MGEGYLDSDTYLSPHSFEAASYAAGAVIEAVERCKNGETERVFCAVRPPGHHAEERSAMGFCIFNNVAIGACHAQKIGFGKIFIIDFDVHHGNGTQHAFEDNNTVFYFSTHQFPLFPGTGSPSEKGKGLGEGYTFNITMEPGAGDPEFINAYQNILPPLVENFSPDLILVSAGYDVVREDPLSSLSVSQKGIKTLVQNILNCSSVPAIFVLEGGYNLAALGESIVITLKEMLK
jgi:acetoin utilization deacetylase AcuC-like enzyme